MINVKDKTCIFEKCKVLPLYNYETHKTPLYCNKHKLTDMVNVKHKHCAF